ncbi:MAG: hypothetical protein R2792_04450 [Saprospiraceae bacterium]
MKSTFTLISALALLFFHPAKTKSSLPPGAGNYTEGVFVVNEGPLVAAAASPGSIRRIVLLCNVFSRAMVAPNWVRLSNHTLHQNKVTGGNGANRILCSDARTFQFLIPLAD